MSVKIKSMDMTIDTFGSFKTAVVDSCSLIYMKKAGFLEPVIKTIVLHVPESVLEETGFTELPLTTHSVCKTDGKSVDMCIVELAKYLEIPVISEDKEILENVSKAGLVFYNAAMVLNFLLYKKALLYEKFLEHENCLFEIAHYSKKVISYSRLVTEKINEL